MAGDRAPRLAGALTVARFPRELSLTVCSSLSSTQPQLQPLPLPAQRTACTAYGGQTARASPTRRPATRPTRGERGNDLMAALPGAYSAILSDLNRDVLRAQPSDLLQFCFSWFGQRLEHERAIARRQQQQQGQQGQGQQQFGYQRDGGSREASPASGTIAMSTSTATTDDDARTSPFSHCGIKCSMALTTVAARSINSKLSFVDKSFTFGSSSGINMDDRAGSPGAGARPAYSSVDPSGPYRSGSPFSAPPSTTAAAAAAAGEPSQISPRKASAFGAYQQQQQQQQHAPSSSSRPPNDDREDDTDDDDADAPPPGWRGGGGGAGGGGPFGGAGALSVDDGGIPAGYNLGRRTSVSAESLDPTSAASTAAAAVALPKTVIPKTASQVARIEGSIKGNLLFRNLDEDQHKDVINAMKEVVVRAGTEVIVQGAVGDFFYVVEEGSFEGAPHPPPLSTSADGHVVAPQLGYVGPQRTLMPARAK